MMTRQYLKKSVRLSGTGDNGTFIRTFEIRRVVSEGASSICYEAFYKDSAIGILKEFYPWNAYVLERDEEGQLVRSEEFYDADEWFLNAQREYLEPYQMLLDVKRNSGDQDLATFIPTFEIYYGCDKEGRRNGTVYMWTPRPRVETFDKICEEIHAHPGKNPEHKLIQILYAIDSLAKRVCALHCADLLHRDINPSNFGFEKLGDETLTQTLQMFDINSICSVFGKMDGTVGTEGYMEPEAGYEIPTNQTDLYSIGATLFYALVICDETREGGFLYRRDYYDRLGELVDASRLLRASEANSHPRLRNILTTILKKCLCERTYRYANCEELIEDLDKAICFALPSELAKKHIPGAQWVLSDLEKSLDKNRDKNSRLAIQYHLYEKPLYQNLKKEDASLNVLVIGFGNYGQKFLDVCLQNGQFLGQPLFVTAISDDGEGQEFTHSEHLTGKITDRELYLSERPELPDFFDIAGRDGGGRVSDGSEDPGAGNGGRAPEDVYGKILFETRKFRDNDQNGNAAVIQAILREHYADRRLHYVFVALGEDERNLQTARACIQALGTLGMGCPVSYVCEKENDCQDVLAEDSFEGGWPALSGAGGCVPDDGRQAAECGLYPVFVNAERKTCSHFAEIERMAFNTHLVWKKEQNLPWRDVKAEFKKPYNHDSCVSSVLSLKYKLHWLGIDLDAVGAEAAARRFIQTGCCSAKKTHELKNQLICMEHRRWVTEKLCLGWRRIRDLDDCAAGTTKDERQKRHVCIVRSRPDQKLSAEFEKGGSCAKWDTATEEELDGLDELDRLSVGLHRMYVKAARKAKQHNLLGGHIITEIKSLASEDQKTAEAFWEWYVCLENIWGGENNRDQANLYEGLKQSLLRAVDLSEVLPAAEKKTLAAQVQTFHAMFRPVLESARYRDWKQDDVALIEQIPFILTYTENITMIIPYETGENKEFYNVAAPSVVSPKRILYLYSIRKKQDLTDLFDSVPYAVNYMKRKNFHASADFLLLCKDSVITAGSRHPDEASAKEEIEAKLKISGNGRIRKVKCFLAAQAEDAYPALQEYLEKKFQTGRTLSTEKPGKSRDVSEKTAGKGKMVCAEKNETRLSYFLEGKGFYDLLPHYSFDSAAARFLSVQGCEPLSYIKKKSCLSVADMTALKRSGGAPGRASEFTADYKNLWKKYCGSRGAWKALCDALGDYTQKNDCLASFRKKEEEEKDAVPQSYCYLIPFAGRSGCEKILSVLKAQEIAEKDSCVSEYSPESCKVTITDRCGYKAEYDGLFSNVYALMLPDALESGLVTKGREVKIWFDNLVVTYAKLPGGNSQSKALLSWFSEKGYIINLRTAADGKVSFTFATRQVKELLTKAGKMLEVYTYHKLRELGQFDDVAGSYELDWEGSSPLSIKNEFDCIVTKGFRSLFIECKARNELEQDFYFKLSALAKKFGINATAVLIADIPETISDENASVNAMQRKRGEMLGVVTIWKPEEISNIGHTLMRVINGTYSESGELT